MILSQNNHKGSLNLKQWYWVRICQMAIFFPLSLQNTTKQRNVNDEGFIFYLFYFQEASLSKMALPRFLAHLIRRLLHPAPVETQRYKDPCRSIWKNYTRAYDAPIPRDVPCNHHLAQGVKVQHMHPLAPIIQLRVAFV